MSEFIILSLVAAAGLVLFSKKEQDTKPTSNINPLLDKNTSSIIFPLKPNDENIFVKNMQTALINKGGDISNYILKAGGATGVFNPLTRTAVIKLGYTSGVISKYDYDQIVNNTNINRNYAIVSDANGADIYKSVGDTYLPAYGYGREPILKIPNRTYLGTATGNYKNGMLEVSTTINVKSVLFFVDTTKIILYSKEEYNSLRDSKILEKTDGVKAKLMSI